MRICILLLAGRPTNCPGSRGRRRLWLRGETLLRKRLIRLILSVEQLLHHTSLPEAGLIEADGQGLSFGDWKAWRPWPDLPSLGPGGARRPVSPPSSPWASSPGAIVHKSAPFSQSKMPTGGNWPKVLLSALNNSPPEMSSHKWTIRGN